VDSIEFILMILAVFIGLPVILGLLIFYVPKKLGFPKAAKWLMFFYVVAASCFGVSILFEDQMFTKGQAKKLLQEQNVILSNDFVLKENKSMSAIGDYYHTFTLEISDSDRTKIIETIKTAATFKMDKRSLVDFQSSTINRYSGPAQLQSYETDIAFVTEFFKPNGKGYSPTFRRITVSKSANTLQFEDIDD
jgi:hypothetical protein